MQVMLYFYHPDQDEMDGHAVRLCHRILVSLIQGNWVEPGSDHRVPVQLSSYFFLMTQGDYSRVYSAADSRADRSSNATMKTVQPETADRPKHKCADLRPDRAGRGQLGVSLLLEV